MVHPVVRAPHMDVLSRTFLLILKKVAFNQAVFSGRKIIPQTSKPGSDTNMAPWQSRANWTEVFNELNNAVKMRHYSPHDGKGQKDRPVPIPIPEALMDEERRRYHILNPQWANTRFAPTVF